MKVESIIGKLVCAVAACRKRCCPIGDSLYDVTDLFHFTLDFLIFCMVASSNSQCTFALLQLLCSLNPPSPPSTIVCKIQGMDSSKWSYGHCLYLRPGFAGALCSGPDLGSTCLTYLHDAPPLMNLLQGLKLGRPLAGYHVLIKSSFASFSTDNGRRRGKTFAVVSRVHSDSVQLVSYHSILLGFQSEYQGAFWVLPCSIEPSTCVYICMCFVNLHRCTGVTYMKRRRQEVISYI